MDVVRLGDKFSHQPRHVREGLLFVIGRLATRSLQVEPLFPVSTGLRPEHTRLCADMRLCQLCAWALPLPPRPIFQVHPRAKVLLIGQAPGQKTRERGIPWDDVSGINLRAWLGIDPTVFYDPRQVAVLPMGLCYPGKGRTGDLPPRPECAPRWHPSALAMMSEVQLTIYIGRYAFERYLGEHYLSVTGAVQDFRRLLPERVAIPHPSPRNRSWLGANPWFMDQAIPEIRAAVQSALKS